MQSAQYFDGMSEILTFYFNMNIKNGKVILHNGSKTAHTHILMNSVNLLRNCCKNGTIHVDGTYQLIKNRFPVFVMGITDMQGQFFPIAFCITSNEEEIDYFYFFDGIKKQCQIIGVKFRPKYIMLDAAAAGFNAAEKVFPQAKLMMCYFHVKMNIKKHFEKKLGPKY